MRTLRLARIAAEAEGLRLRTRAQRVLTRVVLGLLALLFLLGAVAFGHIALWFWMRIDRGWSQTGTALVFAGGDLVLAAFIALLCVRSTPTRVEIEALAVRTRAMEAAASTIALSSLVMPVLRVMLSLLRRRRPGD